MHYTVHEKCAICYLKFNHTTAFQVRDLSVAIIAHMEREPGVEVETRQVIVSP